MKRQIHARPGFTLIEVLVIIAILAALSAALVPVVTGQIERASIQRVVGDLVNVRTGAEVFLTDVQRYPGDIEDLSAAVTDSDADVDGNDYPSGLRSEWDGPYIDRVMADGDSLETGLSAYIQDDLESVQHTNSINYLTVVVSSIDYNDCLEVDETIDGEQDNDAGRLRCKDVDDSTQDTLRYLAIPIN